MSPRHKLIFSVALVAGAIALAWVVLFRRQVLVVVPEQKGPTLSELTENFNEQFEEYQVQLEKIRDDGLNGVGAATGDKQEKIEVTDKSKESAPSSATAPASE